MKSVLFFLAGIVTGLAIAVELEELAESDDYCCEDLENCGDKVEKESD